MKYKNLLLLFCLFFILIGNVAFGQHFIYFYSGNVTYKEGNGPEKYVYYKYNVQPSSIFNLGKGAELIISDEKLNFLLIKEEGTYSGADLLKIFSNKSQVNFAASAIQFISNEFLHPHDDLKKYADKHLKQKGGVYRSGCVEPLMLIPSYDQKIADTVIRFVWNKDPFAREYELRITDAQFDPNQEEVFYRATTTDTFLVVNVGQLPIFKKDSLFSWVVNPVGSPNCARYTFTYVPDNKIQTLKKHLVQSLNNNLSLSESLMELAVLFENNGLISEALACYEFAYQITGNVSYVNMLNFLRARHGLIKP